jgi:hypothetical protein
LQRPDRDHGEFGSCDLAGNDRLQAQDRSRGHNYGVDGSLRHRAMRAPPEQTNLQTVGGSHYRTGAAGNRSGWPRHHVLTEDHVGFRKTLEQPIIDHGLGAFGGFLGRLKYRHQRASPRPPRLREQGGCADEPGYVHIVAAHMANGDQIAFVIFRLDLAGVGQAGRLLDRQCVHISARSMTVGPSPLRIMPTTPVFAHARGDVKTRSAKPVCRQAGGPRLRHRQFRMRMYILVERFEVWQQLVQICKNRLRRACPLGCQFKLLQDLRSSTVKHRWPVAFERL